MTLQELPTDIRGQWKTEGSIIKHQDALLLSLAQSYAITPNLGVVPGFHDQLS